MRDFKKLKIWKQGIDLTKQVYLITKELPKEEKYGIASQMTRAAVSIPSNVAEGGARNSEKEYKRFLEIALGSAFELETQLIICNELGFLEKEDFASLIESISEEQKMISTFIKRLKV